MAELQRSQSDHEGNATTAENASYRSRASSVISTGTKVSISTLPSGHYHIDGVLEGSHSRDMAARPASLYSVRSMAPSLPPYEAHQPMDVLLSTNSNPMPLNTLRVSTNNDLQIASSTANDSEHPSPPSDPENALSMHYGRVVRTIDENHARQLALVNSAHAQEIATSRNAIDQAYRKEWKAKDREIQCAREEAANEIEGVRREAAAEVAAAHEEIELLATTHENTVASIQQENDNRLNSLNEEHRVAIEKARNAVEDLWEARWNDRKKLAAEEARRTAQEAERREQQKDQDWLQAIRTLHPDLVDEISKAVDSARRRVSG